MNFSNNKERKQNRKICEHVNPRNELFISIAKVNNSVHSQGLKVISLFDKLLDPNPPIDECLLRIEYTVFQNFIQAIFFFF